MILAPRTVAKTLLPAGCATKELISFNIDVSTLVERYRLFARLKDDWRQCGVVNLGQCPLAQQLGGWRGRDERETIAEEQIVATLIIEEFQQSVLLQFKTFRRIQCPDICLALFGFVHLGASAYAHTERLAIHGVIAVEHIG